MKKYIILLLTALIICSCEDFLDTTDYTKKNSDNFPQSRLELDNALTAAYSILTSVDLQRDSPFLWATIMGDECFGNGGTGDLNWQGYGRMLRAANLNEHERSWAENYKGIWRCNSIFEMLPQAESFFLSADDRSEYLGQVYALRAYYYYNLASMFGHYVPLRLEMKVENKPAATAEELYAQIADDLNNAITLLPAKSVQQLGTANYGRVTRWAAQAMMARVYMFYTGYYGKTELPTLSSSITKQQIISWLEDCINNSGHALLPDYRNNYSYGNEFTARDYPYAQNNNLKWVGDDGTNTEAVFVVKFNINQQNYRGRMYGLRSQPKADTYPFRDGWGATSVNPKFVENWIADEPNDIRRKASIVDVNDPEEGMNYTWFIDQGEETGYFIKKLLDVNGRNEVGEIRNFSLLAYGHGDGQADCAVDQILIRFSDVLLMHSELTETDTNLNLVRARVGLPDVPYSREAIEKERRYELAFDGYRYYDLLRWYGTEAGAIIDANQNGATYYRAGNPTVMQGDVTNRLRATGGFIDLPKSELDLSQGVLKQNPGWEGEGVMYQP